MSKTDMRKGRSNERERGPLGVEEAVNLMEDCLLAPHCRLRHRPPACEKFKDLSLQHRQSVIAEKELCARCLRHSDLDESKKKDCIRRMTPPHWLSSSVRRLDRSPSRERELPPPMEGQDKVRFAEGRLRSESNYAVQRIEADVGYCSVNGRGEGGALQDSAVGNRDAGRWPP